MVSRRNFFAVTAVMAIICFLFQSLNMAKEYWNDYDVNPSVQQLSGLPGRDEAFPAGQTASGHPLVVCIGDKEDAGPACVKQWALYTKWEFQAYSSLDEYQKARDEKNPSIIVAYAENIDWTKEKDTESLKSCVEQGINLVFATLPDVKIIRQNRELRQLLGIEKVVKNSTTVDGLHLYQGLLLGGETIYQAKTEEEKEDQDMELTFPWYSLTSGTKVYMKGIPGDESVKTEEYPVVLWRKSCGSAYVFAVNGSYMEDVSGLGLLTGMVSETSSYSIYPVVNAQNLIAVNYPGMADENQQKIQELYSRSMKSVFRDIIWPTVAAVYEENNLGLSCMMAPQFDYSDRNFPDKQDLAYYLKVINELEGETGLSGYSVSDTDLEHKLEEDAELMKAVPNYVFSSFYGAGRTEEEIKKALQDPLLKYVRTVIEPYDEKSDILGFLTDQVTCQKITADAYNHTYREDFKTKSIESALGYTGILLDLSRAAYPQEEGDSWEKLSEKFSSDIKACWSDFKGFDGTTVSESDGRVRNFLTMDYWETREGDKIRLNRKNTEETLWFILRTHNEDIEKVKGGEFKELEEGAWLIQVEEEEAVITMKPSDERYYHQ